MPLYHKKFINPASKEWVVFIHGAGGSSSIWFRQIRHFKRFFNVLLVDLRGHGNSADVDLGPIDYSFENISKEVIEVLDHLNIEKAHFVGISLGTILIQTIADLEPNRVKSMILGGAILRLDFRSQFLVGMGNVFKKVVPYMWLYRLFAWVIMPRRRHRKSRLMFVNDAKKLCQSEFLRWYSLTFKVNSLVRYLKQNDNGIPTIYLMGSEDHMFLPPVRAVVEKEKNALLSIIKDSGHVCNVDQAKIFNELATAFIQKNVQNA